MVEVRRVELLSETMSIKASPGAAVIWSIPLYLSLTAGRQVSGSFIDTKWRQSLGHQGHSLTSKSKGLLFYMEVRPADRSGSMAGITMQLQVPVCWHLMFVPFFKEAHGALCPLP